MIIFSPSGKYWTWDVSGRTGEFIWRNHDDDTSDTCPVTYQVKAQSEHCYAKHNFVCQSGGKFPFLNYGVINFHKLKCNLNSILIFL